MQEQSGLLNILSFNLHRFTQLNEEAFWSNFIADSSGIYPDATVNCKLDKQNHLGQFETTGGSLTLTQINSYISQCQNSACTITGSVIISVTRSSNMQIFSSQDFELARRVIAKTMAITSHAPLSINISAETFKVSPTTSPIPRPSNPQSFMFDQQMQTAPPLNAVEVTTQVPPLVNQSEEYDPRKKTRVGF